MQKQNKQTLGRKREKRWEPGESFLNRRARARLWRFIRSTTRWQKETKKTFSMDQMFFSLERKNAFDIFFKLKASLTLNCFPAADWRDCIRTTFKDHQDKNGLCLFVWRRVWLTFSLDIRQISMKDIVKVNQISASSQTEKYEDEHVHVRSSVQHFHPLLMFTLILESLFSSRERMRVGGGSELKIERNRLPRSLVYHESLICKWKRLISFEKCQQKRRPVPFKYEEIGNLSILHNQTGESGVGRVDQVGDPTKRRCRVMKEREEGRKEEWKRGLLKHNLEKPTCVYWGDVFVFCCC